MRYSETVVPDDVIVSIKVNCIELFFFAFPLLAVLVDIQCTRLATGTL